MRRWSGPLIVAAAAAAGLVWSWGTWLDPTIDFGRELYVPWRLTEGDVLFRDIVSFNGPLSHYLLAGWFAITGASLLSLVVLNAAVLGATLALVYALLSRIAGAGAGTLSCLTFVAVFAFGSMGPRDMVPTGNYNWICPYSHELTHGIALSLLALYAGYRFAAGARTVWAAAAAGLVLGLVFLTKAEVFAAAAAASAIGLAATLWLNRCSASESARVVAAWAAGALVAPAVSVLLLATALPFDDALRGTLGTWPHLLATTHTDLPYFRWGMGTDDPVGSLVRMLASAAAYAAWLLPVAALAWSRRGARPGRLAVAAVFSLPAVLLAVAWLGFGWPGWFDGRLLQWNDLPRPWQLLLLGVGIAFAWPAWRREIEPEQRPVAALRLAVIAFALLLLGKMLFNVRVFHYGFALAAPAAWVVVALFWSWLPDGFERRGAPAAPLRAAFLAVWLVVLVAHVSHAHGNLKPRDHIVGTGADAFRAPPRGEILSEALQWLERRAGPSDTLAAIPEGTMLNYQLRRASSTPFVQYTPPLMLLFGEDRMIASLAGSPPDWIVLVHRSDADYGVPFFGYDYGVKLLEWIQQRYVFAARMGAPPFRGSRFGIVILKKRG